VCLAASQGIRRSSSSSSWEIRACLVIGAFFFFSRFRALRRASPCVAERGLMSGTVSFNFHSQSPKAIDFSHGRHLYPSVPTPPFCYQQFDSVSIYYEL
jgi:hypothetical protein